MLLWLRLVTRRFVGVVGGVRSLAAAATEPTTTSARTRANTAAAARRTTVFFPVMSFLPVTMPGRADGVWFVIGAKLVNGFRGLVGRCASTRARALERAWAGTRFSPCEWSTLLEVAYALPATRKAAAISQLPWANGEAPEA